MGNDIGNGDAGKKEPAPRRKIAIPDVFQKANRSSGSSGGGSSGTTSVPESRDVDKKSSQSDHTDGGPAVSETIAKVDRATVSSPQEFQPISPGLSSISLPLGPAPKEISREDKAVAAEVSAPKEKPTVGCLVEFFMGKGQVRAIREDGLLEVWAVGWEMAGERRPRYFLRADAVKVVPTVYYQMPVLDRLQMSAWLKEEGGRMFKGADYKGAAESYMKAIGVLKTCEFSSNAHNARALEIMIPCHNNAATCYMKIKNFADARRLADNVDTLCSALERNKGGKVMKALKERGVEETTVLGQWWSKGLFLGGKACLYEGENQQAVTCLRKGIKIAKPASLAKLRNEIGNELEKATKRLASQQKKEQKMWSKAFSKNSNEPESAKSVSSSRPLPQPHSSGIAQSSVMQRLEEIARKGDPSINAGHARQNGDDAALGDQEDDDDDDYDDEDLDEESRANAVSKGLLWGTLAVGVAAVSVGAMVALRNRH